MANTRPLKTLLARALYNNEAEFPSELAFHRGEVVTVLERDPKGYEGWWICSLNGQLGIVPGNRFEILGTVEPKHNNHEADVYDDPVDWLQNNRKLPLTLKKPECDPNMSAVYENLTLNPPCSNNRTSGLTDSGNYSNRSSDLSINLPSMMGSQERHVNLRTPDSQYEDYEDLDAALELGDVVEQRSTCCEQLAGTPQDSVPTCSVQLLNPLDNQQKKFTEQQLMGSYSSDFSPTPNTKNDVSGNSREHGQLSSGADGACTMDLENFSLNSDESFGSVSELDRLQTGLLKCKSEFVRNLNSKHAFIHSFDPIKQRIEINSKHISTIIQSHQPEVGTKHNRQERARIGKCENRSIPSELVGQFAKDLAVFAQICTGMVTTAKASSDAGLTRKFIQIKKTLDRIIPQINRVLEELSPPGLNLHSGKVQILSKLSALLQCLMRTLDALDTTVLANSSLLFNRREINLPTDSTSPQCLSGNQILPTTSFPDNIPVIPPSLTKVSDLRIPATQTILTRNSPPSDPKLDDQLDDLRVQCELSLNSVQSLLDLVGPFASSNSHSIPSHVYLTPSILTYHVKAIMKHCVELIRSVAGCRSFIRDTLLIGPLTCASLCDELEGKGGALCETLKGLVTQTKEVNKYLTDKSSQNRAITHEVPLPGPLLQRLHGSGRSVSLSIGALIKYLQTYHCST
ncbi:hypothetical protein EG68_06157 [Paragonimus skrjabini miyazakii]|uniref:SH3 domain-containing protein n=1 Tax=Paragonimus skrjabini miyazakii TaxID=59628 RepID=A0A8S9YQ08_9TREM|nr:hypothetical protein EG68_06157 [Paragonimus skrjabini miyazakii]